MKKSLIFTYNSWNNCSCDQYQGYQIKTLWQRLYDEQEYCYVCRVKIAYNADRIYKMKKITETYNNYPEMKKDLQFSIDFGCIIIKQLEKENGVALIGYLKNYINNTYYDVCYYNQ